MDGADWRQQKRKAKVKRLVWGIIVVVLGVIFLIPAGETPRKNAE